MTNSQKIEVNNKKMIAYIKWTAPCWMTGLTAVSTSSIKEENIGNTVLINRKTGDEKCVKCKKNVLNGIRCISCLKAWHCECGGFNKEDIKSAIVKDNK